MHLGVKKRKAQGAFRFITLGLLAFMLTFWKALETVVDWVLLDWGIVARGVADDLVPEIQMIEARRVLERLKPILQARGIVC